MSNTVENEKTDTITDTTTMGFKIIKTVLSNPITIVDREKFLTEALGGKVSPSTLEKAIADGTKAADIPLDIIQDAAKKCIKQTKAISNSESALTGLPGGVAGISLGIVADITQFYGNLIILIQKLLYLYGVGDLRSSKDDFASAIMIYIGVACGFKGIDDVAKVLFKILQKNYTEQSVKLILFAKPLFYATARKVAKVIGIKLSKKLWAKVAAKSIPLIGAGISGTLNWVTFTPAANKLLNFFNEKYNMPFDESSDEPIHIIEKSQENIYIEIDEENDIDFENINTALAEL